MPKKRPPKNDVGRDGVLTTKLPNDVGSLEARRSMRSIQNLATVDLVVSISTARGIFRYSFENRTKLNDTLVRQCLLATNQSLEGRIVSSTVIQDSYLGISEFLDFCETRIGSSFQISSFENIDIQVGRDFLAWYLLKFPGRGVNRKRYGKVCAIISAYKTRYENAPHVGRLLVWPSGPPTSDNPTAGYPKENFNSLVEAAISDVRFVMKEMSRVESKIKDWAYILIRPPSIADACLEVDLWEKKNSKRFKFPSDKFQAMRSLKVVRDACRSVGMTPQQFVEIYLGQGGELSRSGTIFPSYSIVKDESTPSRYFSGLTVRESEEIAIKTFFHFQESWPLGMYFKKASEIVSCGEKYEMREEMIKAHTILQHGRFGDLCKPMEVGLLAYLSNFYFTSATLYPFFLYVQQNTGWNAETILSIGCNLDEHISPDIIDPNYVVLWGWKGRTESVMQHRTNTKSPYSVYSVLRFVEKIVRRMNIASGRAGGTIWQYVLAKNLWPKFSSITQEFTIASAGAMSSAFLDRHSILLSSRQKLQRIDSRRIRTTVQTRRREAGYSIYQSSSQMGHVSTDTTWKNYDGDVYSNMLKDERLRKVQENLIEDVESYAVRLVESTTLQDLRSAIEEGHLSTSEVRKVTGISEREVIYLLSPYGQTYIAGCLDRRNPTWERADEFVSDEDLCNYFNKCCLCRNSIVFSEALPFIYRRIRDLDLLRAELNLHDWFANYSQEYDAWLAILDDWSDKEQLQEAEKHSFLQKYVLPFNMRGTN